MIYSRVTLALISLSVLFALSSVTASAQDSPIPENQIGLFITNEGLGILYADESGFQYRFGLGLWLGDPPRSFSLIAEGKLLFEGDINPYIIGGAKVTYVEQDPEEIDVDLRIGFGLEYFPAYNFGVYAHMMLFRYRIALTDQGSSSSDPDVTETLSYGINVENGGVAGVEVFF